MDQLELVCPFCVGRFQTEASPETRTTTCPHCQRPVTVPAASTAPPSPPASPSLEQASDACVAAPSSARESGHTIVNRRGETVPLRRLSPDERARYRRRLSVVYAVLGIIVLAVLSGILLRLGP